MAKNYNNKINQIYKFQTKSMSKRWNSQSLIGFLSTQQAVTLHVKAFCLVCIKAQHSQSNFFLIIYMYYELFKDQQKKKQLQTDEYRSKIKRLISSI